MDHKYTFTKSETEDKQIKLTVKIEPADFVKVREQTYNHLAKDVVITGFRPGKAPKALIEARISNSVLEETINHLLPEITFEILTKEKLTPLNQLKYEVAKVSDGDGLEYTATFVNYPEFKLVDPKEIKIKKEEVTLDEKEITAEIARIVKVYGPKTEGKGEANVDPKTAEKPEVKVELTDEQVKSFKLGLNTVDELKAEVKKQLEANKKYVEEEKWLKAVIEEAIIKSKVPAPQVLLDDDLARHEQSYLKRIEELGLKLDDFLQTQNTTIEKLREEWKRDSESKIKQELLLSEIIRRTQIQVSEAEIASELAAITDENLKKEMDSASGKRYIGTVLLQQKALAWLKEAVEKQA